MADISYEIGISLDLEDQGLSDSLKGIISDAEQAIKPFGDSLNDQLDSMKIFTRQVETQIALNQYKLKQAEMMAKFYADDAEQLNKVTDILSEVIESTEMWASQSDKLMQTHLEQLITQKSQIDRIGKSLDDNIERSSALSNILQDAGLGRLIDDFNKLKTLGGQVAFWAGMFKEAAGQVTNWRNQNYALFGSINAIASSVRDTQASANVLQKEAEQAADALMQLAVTKNSIDRLSESTANFAASTGAGADSVAGLAKSMQVISLDSKFNSQLIKMEGLAAKFGITGKDSSAILGFLDKNMKILSNTVGSSRIDESLDNIQLGFAAAKVAGMEMSAVSDIMQKLTDDVTNFAVLLNNDLDRALQSGDPGSNFLLIAENASDALEMAKAFPAGMREALSKEIFGVSQSQLQELAKLDEAVQDFKKTISAKPGTKEYEKAISDFAEQHRRSTDPIYALTSLLDDLKNIFIEVVSPIITVVAKIASFVRGMIEAHPWVKSVMTALAAMALIITTLTVAAVGLKVTMFALGTAFSIFGGSVLKASAAVGSASKSGGMMNSLRSLGKGIAGFTKGLNGISLVGVFKAAAALTILGGALALIGFVMNSAGIGPEMLLSLGVSLIAVAGAAALLGVVGSAAAVPMVIAAGAIGILGVAMLVASSAFWVFSKAVENLSRIDLVSFGNDFRMFASAMLNGSLELSAAMIALLGASVMAIPTALAMAVSLPLMGLSLGAFLGLLSRNAGGIPVLNSLANVFSTAMSGIAAGVSILVDSAYIRFAVAAKSMSYGLNSILSTLGRNADGVRSLVVIAASFTVAMSSLAAGSNIIKNADFDRLNDVAESLNDFNFIDMTKADQFVKYSDNIKTSLGNIGNGLNVYATYVESASMRVVDAVQKASIAASDMNINGIEEIVNSNAVVTVKSDVDNNVNSDIAKKQSEYLESISNKLSELNIAVTELSGKSDNSENISKILDQLTQHLPAIAEGDKELGSSMSQW